MAKKKKDPFTEFAERSEEIRKIPVDKEKIRRINEWIDESEREEEEEAVAEESQIARSNSSHAIEA